jgi:hypothetical protein
MKSQNFPKDIEIFIEKEDNINLTNQPLSVSNSNNNRRLNFMKENFIINPDSHPETVLIKAFKDYEQFAIFKDEFQKVRFTNVEKVDFTYSYDFEGMNSNLTTSTTDSNFHLLNKKTNRTDDIFMAKKTFELKLDNSECII